MDAAVHDVRTGSLSYRAAAKRHGVQYWTLFREVHGENTNVNGLGRPIVLGPAIEEAIAQFVITCARRAMPLPTTELGVMATAMAEGLGIRGFKASERWYSGMLRRHKELRRRIPQSISVDRWTSLTRSNAMQWIDLVRAAYFEVSGTESPAPCQVFNMDESPMNPQSRGGAVFGEKGAKTYRVTSPYRDFFTAVVCVCADGTLMRPLLIFKGKHKMSTWFPPRNPDRYTPVDIECSPEGVMTTDIFVDWLELFSKSIAESVPRPVILFLDNHSSHVSAESLWRAKELGIVLIGLPSNTTSKFQPLDVGAFSPLKAAWNKLKNA
jgi:hypothetical protein